MSNDSEDYVSDLQRQLQPETNTAAPSGETAGATAAERSVSRIAVKTAAQRQPRAQVGTAGRGLSGAKPDDQAAASGAAFEAIARDLLPLAVPIASLQPAPDNARRHADRDIQALMDSLRRFGQRKAIVAKRAYRGIANAVLAGNGTVLAARRLGWTDLAVSWFGGNDDEARAYALSDNRTAELSEWDTGRLADLQADGCDLLSLWHNDAGLADLLGASAPIPRFEPEPEAGQRRLDQFAENTTCPACGHRFHREAL